MFSFDCKGSKERTLLGLGLFIASASPHFSDRFCLELLQKMRALFNLKSYLLHLATFSNKQNNYYETFNL
ncbi:MAG: hypothetical protein ACI857_002753 [Arenicella sp.]|jgi:hypothetical protein